ncbi:MAG: methyltransferase domain-containing protein [Chloroflexi bacterium]|nr:methyltransferase domain-containing protein [Chloroflexota bacterium]
MTWSDDAREVTGNGPPVAALVTDLIATLPWLADLRSERLRVLEAAGAGEGADTLVPLGHTVVVLNAAQELLDAARARLMADPDRLIGNVALTRGSIADVPRRWPPNAFDLILCHTVFEQSIDPQAVLTALVAVLKPGGYLSLAFTQSADDRSNGDHPTHLTAETVASWLSGLDVAVVRRGGVGGPGEPAPGVEDGASHLQEAIQAQMGAGPGLARYCHLLARKPIVFPMPL